jgi:hypothetical protein
VKRVARGPVIPSPVRAGAVLNGGLTPPASFVTLEVGMWVEFEPESGPKGLGTADITVTTLKTPLMQSFQELADHFHRHAAG